MPPKFKKRRNQRKKPQLASLIPSEPKWTAKTWQNPISSRLVTTLKYNEVVTLSIPVGPGFVDYLFNLNSIFDPNRTGAGHQPKGRDQLATLYNRYRVYSTKAAVKLVVSGADVAPTKLVIVPSNSTTAFANITDAEETFGSRSNWYSIYAQPVTSGVYNLPEINGRSRKSYEADDLTQANVGADPAESIILHCCAANTTGLAQTAFLDITLIFHVEFMDPVQLAQS